MYCSDKPILTKEEDLLGRSYFAKQLATSMLLFNNLDTFTVALYGKWGCGKTSVVNMMVQELENMKTTNNDTNIPIIVHFEPWNFSD